MNYMVCWCYWTGNNDWDIINGEDEMHVFVHNLIEKFHLDKDEDITVFDLSDEIE